MSFELPPIVKLAERLMVDVEKAVRRFPRYHKYAIGSELRGQAREVNRLAHRAWRDKGRQLHWTGKLVFAVDDFKLSLQIGKQVHAFGSFAEFEALALCAEELGRQSGGWHKKQHHKRQNAESCASPQRPQTLSTRTASVEANP